MRFLRHSRGSGWHVPFLSLGVATSLVTIHALRLHGRDDHAPLCALPHGSAIVRLGGIGSARRPIFAAMADQGVAFGESVFGAAGRSIAMSSVTVTNL